MSPQQKVDFTRAWYAVRIERISDLAKVKGFWPEVACILANGTASVSEPPTYAQQLNIAKWRAEKAEERAKKLQAQAAAMVDSLRLDLGKYKGEMLVSTTLYYLRQLADDIRELNPSNHL